MTNLTFRKLTFEYFRIEIGTKESTADQFRRFRCGCVGYTFGTVDIKIVN